MWAGTIAVHDITGPGPPLDRPQWARASPYPRICNQQRLPMLYGLSKAPTQFPAYIAGGTRDGYRDGSSPHEVGYNGGSTQPWLSHCHVEVKDADGYTHRRCRGPD